jgi:hypothetical protein
VDARASAKRLPSPFFLWHQLCSDVHEIGLAKHAADDETEVGRYNCGAPCVAFN